MNGLKERNRYGLIVNSTQLKEKVQAVIFQEERYIHLIFIFISYKSFVFEIDLYIYIYILINTEYYINKNKVSCWS